MRILLISPNMEMLPDPVFPLGLAYLNAALARSVHESRVLDLCFVENCGEALSRAVADFAPEAVGISLRNVDNVAFPNSSSYLPIYREVIARLREVTGAPVILGGAGFSLMPHRLLDALGADYGVWGEGEVSLIRLLDRLEKGLPSGGLPGVLSRGASASDDWSGALSPQRLQPDEWVAPLREGLETGKYLRYGGMGNIQTKRGCSFSCTYCTYPLIEGREIRLRPSADVGMEMEALCGQGVEALFIVDDIFNFPPHHAKSICMEILRRGLKVRWSCYLHPGFVTESLLTLMKEAGCTSVEFGTDSGSDRQLARLGKSFTANDVRRASGLCRKAGMPFCHALIFGGPGEDRSTIEETFELMEETGPTAVIAMSGVRIFPGTKMAEEAEPEDVITTGEPMLSPTFFLEHGVAPFLLEMLRAHAERNPHWILPGSNVNINRRLQEKLRRFGLKGPLWEYMQIRRKSRP